MDEKLIYELISQRRTVHRYRKSDIDDELIKRGLELALLAPNHKFTFPWKFIVCGPKAQNAIFEIALSNALKKAEAIGEDHESVRNDVTEKFLNPAKIVLFARKKTAELKQSHEDYASVACAIQNFTTYLSGNGYDSKWSTGSVSTSDKIYKIAGLNPEEFVIDGLIIVGKNIADRYPPRRRPSVAEVAVYLD